ncbi:MAG: DUF3109 domain-containing protein, partial [Ignavibacteriaceae bacterium]
FPITIYEHALTLDDEHIDRLKKCNRTNESETTIIDFCKDELTRFLGEDGYKKLLEFKEEYLNGRNK